MIRSIFEFADSKFELDNKEWVTHRFLYAKRHNNVGAGISLRALWNSEKWSNFKAHELPWTVNELCTRILRVPSSCPPVAHINRWILKKIILLQYLAPTCNTSTNKKKNHTQLTRQRKLGISSNNAMILNTQLYLNLLFFKM